MPLRNPHQALLIDVPRTGNNPEQIARAVLPDRQRKNALEVLGNPLRLVSVGSSLLSLGGHWYILILEDTIYFGFAPSAGVSKPNFDRINIAARTSTIPMPWADEPEEIAAVRHKLPEAFRERFH